MSVGWPASVHLDVWARMLYEVFGDMPYLVGSATKGKDWRDVDVVVMMGPEKFYSWAGPHGMHGIRWKAVCAAFSCWGTEITGLPIDFKIQPVKWANEKHKGGREALGMRMSPDFIEKEYPDCLQATFPRAEESLSEDEG